MDLQIYVFKIYLSNLPVTQSPIACPAIEMYFD